jgi:alpha-tubulin suppressor-like RCC1 family protein
MSDCPKICIPFSQYSPDLHELIGTYNTEAECVAACKCDEGSSSSVVLSSSSSLVSSSSAVVSSSSSSVVLSSSSSAVVSSSSSSVVLSSSSSAVVSSSSSSVVLSSSSSLVSSSSAVVSSSSSSVVLSSSSSALSSASSGSAVSSGTSSVSCEFSSCATQFALLWATVSECYIDQTADINIELAADTTCFASVYDSIQHSIDFGPWVDTNAVISPTDIIATVPLGGSVICFRAVGPNNCESVEVCTQLACPSFQSSTFPPDFCLDSLDYVVKISYSSTLGACPGGHCCGRALFDFYVNDIKFGAADLNNNTGTSGAPLCGDRENTFTLSLTGLPPNANNEYEIELRCAEGNPAPCHMGIAWIQIWAADATEGAPLVDTCVPNDVIIPIKLCSSSSNSSSSVILSSSSSDQSEVSGSCGPCGPNLEGLCCEEASGLMEPETAGWIIPPVTSENEADGSGAVIAVFKFEDSQNCCGSGVPVTEPSCSSNHCDPGEKCCPSGCCPEDWYCCPDGLYCAASPADCPAASSGAGASGTSATCTDGNGARQTGKATCLVTFDTEKNVLLTIWGTTERQDAPYDISEIKITAQNSDGCSRKFVTKMCQSSSSGFWQTCDGVALDGDYEQCCSPLLAMAGQTTPGLWSDTPFNDTPTLDYNNVSATLPTVAHYIHPNLTLSCPKASVAGNGADGALGTCDIEPIYWTACPDNSGGGASRGWHSIAAWRQLTPLRKACAETSDSSDSSASAVPIPDHYLSDETVVKIRKIFYVENALTFPTFADFPPGGPFGEPGDVYEDASTGAGYFYLNGQYEPISGYDNTKVGWYALVYVFYGLLWYEAFDGDLVCWGLVENTQQEYVAALECDKNGKPIGAIPPPPAPSSSSSADSDAYAFMCNEATPIGYALNTTFPEILLYKPGTAPSAPVNGVKPPVDPAPEWCADAGKTTGEPCSVLGAECNGCEKDAECGTKTILARTCIGGTDDNLGCEMGSQERCRVFTLPAGTYAVEFTADTRDGLFHLNMEHNFSVEWYDVDAPLPECPPPSVASSSSAISSSSAVSSSSACPSGCPVGSELNGYLGLNFGNEPIESNCSEYYGCSGADKRFIIYSRGTATGLTSGTVFNGLATVNARHGSLVINHTNTYESSSEYRLQLLFTDNITGAVNYPAFVNGELIELTNVESGNTSSCWNALNGVYSLTTEEVEFAPGDIRTYYFLNCASSSAISSSDIAAIDALYAWGWNDFGQLGDGTTTDRLTPTLIDGEYSIINAGWGHSFALTLNGDLYAWGRNDDNRLGDGTSINRLTPTLIGSGYSAISSFSIYALGLKQNGDLYAWGDNADGAIGDGTTTNRATPTFIGGGYVAISAGETHALGLKQNGDLYAWGNNERGQLGDGTTVNKLTPTFIGTGYSAISAGWLYSLALKTNGDLYAWGLNEHGQLGDGTATDKLTPTLIGSGYSAISVRWTHSLALTPTGDLYAWGNNAYGHLGDGTTTTKLTPTFIGTGYSAISAATAFTVALKQNGDLYAWGSNYYGNIGDGTTTDRLTPTLIGSGYSAITGGGGHVLALKSLAADSSSVLSSSSSYTVSSSSSDNALFFISGQTNAYCITQQPAYWDSLYVYFDEATFDEWEAGNVTIDYMFSNSGTQIPTSQTYTGSLNGQKTIRAIFSLTPGILACETATVTVTTPLWQASDSASFNATCEEATNRTGPFGPCPSSSSSAYSSSSATSSSSNSSSGNIPLFDKASWASAVPEPYKTYLDAAADRWMAYAAFDQSIATAIKAAAGQSWNGIEINQYTAFFNTLNGDDYSNVLAACSVSGYWDIIEPGTGIKFNTVSYNLFINTAWATSTNGAGPLTTAQWIDVLTHELGHALGIGIFWDSSLAADGAVPPVNNFLDGNAYSQAQTAYNSLTGLTRTKIPLEDAGGGGTVSAHWENNNRTASYTGGGGVSYKGFFDELMIGSLNVSDPSFTLKLTPMSLKILVDFGYLQIGAGEGNPQPAIGLPLTTDAGGQIKLNCGAIPQDPPTCAGTICLGSPPY